MKGLRHALIGVIRGTFDRCRSRYVPIVFREAVAPHALQLDKIRRLKRDVFGEFERCGGKIYDCREEGGGERVEPIAYGDLRSFFRLLRRPPAPAVMPSRFIWCFVAASSGERLDLKSAVPAFFIFDFDRDFSASEWEPLTWVFRIGPLEARKAV
jgi:hypothetical protein